MTTNTITVPAARYYDSDDCLEAASEAYIAAHPEAECDAPTVETVLPALRAALQKALDDASAAYHETTISCRRESDGHTGYESFEARDYRIAKAALKAFDEAEAETYVPPR